MAGSASACFMIFHSESKSPPFQRGGSQYLLTFTTLLRSLACSLVLLVVSNLAPVVSAITINRIAYVLRICLITTKAHTLISTSDVRYMFV
ncbi:hypothetical protein F5J12DRAFT_179212 [Pisolithus orientalis]|uniref:uncharacterized protein n=1 Tax=Pisolithus orientalis TaxID=936130 RepID=UPI0022243CD9|nr:uncharacterized protein F5J12DRAFT_179212 [Pisolithus orientalis]KAI6032634.1 hypothetical protein F5J12DRAFT_179212 [Pisolithus orientalis]